MGAMHAVDLLRLMRTRAPETFLWVRRPCIFLTFLFFFMVCGSLATADSTLGPWEYTTSLQTARAGHGMAAGTNSLYVIGGHNGAGTTLSSVEYTAVASDGALSAWQFTMPLNVPRALTAAAAT